MAHAQNRYGAEGEVLGIASVPLRVVLEAPRFQLHTTLNVVGATSGSPPAGKLEVRLQLSTGVVQPTAEGARSDPHLHRALLQTQPPVCPARWLTAARR